jgi:hypothetical protein
LLRSQRKISHNSIHYARQRLHKQLQHAFEAVVAMTASSDDKTSTLDYDGVEAVFYRLGFFSPFMVPGRHKPSTAFNSQSLSESTTNSASDSNAQCRADSSLKRRIMSLLDASSTGRVDRQTVAQFLDLLICRIAAPIQHHHTIHSASFINVAATNALSGPTRSDEDSVAQGSTSEQTSAGLEQDTDSATSFSPEEEAILRQQLTHLAFNSLSYAPQLKKADFVRRTTEQKEKEHHDLIRKQKKRYALWVMD